MHPAWWTLILLVTIVALVFLCAALFARKFTPYMPVTLTSDRAGLVMESGGKVKMRGIQVGRVEAISSGKDSVALRLQIDPDQVQYIP
ncbi:MAG TPA: MlaD family protein, partial [Mycobacterium sp.]